MRAEWTPEQISPTAMDGPEKELHDKQTLRYDDDGAPIIEIVTCGTCGRRWNDAAISGRTPTPSARCPFEHAHGGDDA